MRVIVLLLLLFCPLLNAGATSGAPDVLVINSYHSGLNWTDSIMDGIRETFAQSGRDIRLSAEYMDSRRYVDPERAGLIREAMEAKLKSMSPDLVMVSDNDALDFVLAGRDRLFPGTPVIFLGINSFNPSMLKGQKGITGVAEDASVQETVALALSLHPSTTEIIVVGRTSVKADRANRESFQAALPRLPEGLKVTFWDDLPKGELQKRLEALKKGQVVFLNGLLTDESGRQMMYGETTKWVRNACAVPVYSLWDVYLGFGIVGGKLVSGREQGKSGARLALKVLSGEWGDKIPVVKAPEVNRYMFDYREIERFDVPLSKLPKGSILIHRPDSVLHSHRGFVLLASAVTALLLGLVVFLVIAMIRKRRAEAALRQANLVVERSSVMLFRWKASEGWPVEWASENVSELGYSPEELISGQVPYASILHPDDRERVAAELEEYYATGTDRFDQEYRVVTRAGDVRWVLDQSAAERDASGRIVRYRGVVMDITSRKEAERKLGEKREELDRFFTVTLDLLCIADLEGRFRRLNPQWEVVLGYSLEELEGANFLDFIHPDDVKATEEALSDLASRKAVMGFVNRYRCKDGTYRWIEWRSSPAGDLVYAAARDITEQKLAALALKKSEEKYRDIFERAAEGIFQSTPDGRMLSANPAFAHMLGYESPEALMTQMKDIQAEMYARPEERIEFKEALERAGCDLVAFEHELVRKDGTAMWVSTNARCVRDGQGGILYYEGTSENITERKRAVEEVRRLNEALEQRVKERTAQLEAANKELEAFSYSVSHDLRAPLRAVDGYAQIVMEDYAPLLDEEGRRVCGVIQDNARRMGRLIDDLLAFSRLIRTSMSISKVDMGGLADSVFHEVASPDMRDGIDFRVGELPQAFADPMLIRQVWANLLSNAVKFSSKREHPAIEVDGSRNGGEVIYSVKDNGAGFDMQYGEKLFGVFQRLHSVKEFEGTGVGLAIVERIVKRHGGRVWAEGKPGEGASFFFSLPIKGGRS